MTRSRFATAAMLAYSLLLGGCYTTTRQMYEGAELPKGTAAIIKNIPRMPILLDKEVTIQSVNGRESRPYDVAVEVMPGVNELVVMCVWPTGSGLTRSENSLQQTARITVVVEAGKTYQLDNTQTIGVCSPTIVEEK